MWRRGTDLSPDRAAARLQFLGLHRQFACLHSTHLVLNALSATVNIDQLIRQDIDHWIRYLSLWVAEKTDA